MFLALLEFIEEKWKKKSLRFVEKIAYVSIKLLLEKSAKKRKRKKRRRKNESIHNLWRILGTKLVLLVDF